MCAEMTVIVCREIAMQESATEVCLVATGPCAGELARLVEATVSELGATEVSAVWTAV